MKRIWFSLYTPQKGEESPERLRPEDRERVVDEIASLFESEPKLHDMHPDVVQGYLAPPQNPDECIFAQDDGVPVVGSEATRSRRASTAAIPTARSAAAWPRSASRRSAATVSAAWFR